MPEQCARLIDELIELRKAKGWTQQELARACGLTQSVIGRIESKKSVPTLVTLQRSLRRWMRYCPSIRLDKKTSSGPLSERPLV